MTTSTELTFEDGYTRLQAISARVTSDEVPVAEMCDLFAEGKGLQLALTGYLDEQKSRVEAIERGEGIQAFRIVAPAAPDQRSFEDGQAEGAADVFNFDTTEQSDFVVPPKPVVAADDDIPF